jgi:hypothetical protein
MRDHVACAALRTAAQLPVDPPARPSLLCQTLSCGLATHLKGK